MTDNVNPHVIQPVGRCVVCCDEAEGTERVAKTPLYRDPRDPPLDVDPCLCKAHVIEAYEEAFDTARETAESLMYEMQVLKGEI